MALAALYTEAQSANDLLPKPHGFIVDHKVRPESTEEAEWVAQQLRTKRETNDIFSSIQILIPHSRHGSIRATPHMAGRLRPHRPQAI
jgi:hypothetical protein